MANSLDEFLTFARSLWEGSNRMARTAVRPAAKPTSDEAVFDAWFARHRDELRSFSARLTGDSATAEDVVQETFARAWLNLDRLREREEVGPWLYRVARNLCVDTHRARRRFVHADAYPIKVEESDRPEVADPLRHVEREEEREMVREALGALTDRHRDVLYLRDIQGMAYDELGERHGVSGESARAVLARARRRLREELKTIGNGLFGAGIWVRLRIDGGLRRMGADRLPVEPLTAAVTQYVIVVTAAFGIGAGAIAPPATPPTGVEGRSAVAPSEAGSGAGAVDTGSTAHAPKGLSESGPAGDSVSTPGSPDDPYHPTLTLEAGPEEGLPPNPYDPNGNGTWVGGSVWVQPENAGPAAPLVVPVARAACETGPDVCQPPD